MTEPDKRTIALIEAEDPAGTLAAVDGNWVLTMTRTFPHEPARVWPWLTDPARLAKWSPLVPDRPLDSPGPATSHETPDAPATAVDVLVHDAPRELVHRWDDQVLRWTLTAVGGGTRLQLEHTFADRPEASSYGAGWHVCLAGLTAQLDGDDVERPVGTRALDYGWAELRDAYDVGWTAGPG